MRIQGPSLRPGALLRAALFLIIAYQGLAGAMAQRVHQLQGAREGAIVGGGLLLHGLAFGLERDPVPLWERHGQRNIATIGRIDRGTVGNRSAGAARASDLLFLSTTVATFMVAGFTDDRPVVPLVIMGESLLLSSGLTNAVKVMAHRPRPYVFDTEVPPPLRMRADAYRSFWSGHAANAASLSVACATLVDRSGASPAARTTAWVAAGAVPITMAWLRVRAGRHFPTDVLAGCIAGALVGVAVPYFHRPQETLP